VLLDNLRHARRLGTEENHNALHGLEGIEDRVKNTWRIPWIRVNPVEIGFDKEKGWNPLRDAKQREGKSQITLESPLVAGWRGVERKKKSKKKLRSVEGLNTQGTGLVRWIGQTCLVGRQTGLVWWDMDFFRLGRKYEKSW
jgi:hypothetical protein